jgi:hypothetical protein
MIIVLIIIKPALPVRLALVFFTLPRHHHLAEESKEAGYQDSKEPDGNIGPPEELTLLATDKLKTAPFILEFRI